MKIGVWIGSEVINTQGGGASYQERLIRLIDDYTFSDDIEVCFLAYHQQSSLTKEIVLLSQLPKVLYKLFDNSSFISKVLGKIDRLLVERKGLSKVLKKSGVQVVYYLYQTTCKDPNFPFIATNWDIGYRSTHAFPELVSPLSYAFRDDFYKNILPRALMIICESETGKNELMKYTCIGEHKIRVMPMFAGNVSSIRLSEVEMNDIINKIGIEKNRYFFYPAQFWAHKNHIGLLKAFLDFKKQDKNNVKLVFCGSDKGNIDYIKSKIQEFGLQNDVIILGFIPEETVMTLYNNALCMIMASHFGPTNMPPIEAMELGCPVACSDLGGHREILGDAAVYFNSFDEMSILSAMTEIANNQESYRIKIADQKNMSVFNSQYAMNSLNKILEEVVNIRSNWGVS